MTSGEIISFVIAITSILVSGGVSIFSIKYFNNKRHIYEIKKNAILRTLKFLDDYMSFIKWENKEEPPIKKDFLNPEYLTIEARECYN